MTDKREIPKKEDLGCEFKSDLKRLSDSELIDTVVALSNTDGGVLYLGVEDDGTPTGIHEAHADTTGFRHSCQTRRCPPSPPEPPCCGSPRMGRRTRRACGSWAPRGAEIHGDRRLEGRRDPTELIKADGSPEAVPMYPYEIITRLSTLGSARLLVVSLA